jgi:hypothetical protein
MADGWHEQVEQGFSNVNEAVEGPMDYIPEDGDYFPDRKKRRWTKQARQGLATIVFVLIIGIAIGVAALYFYLKRKKAAASTNNQSGPI